MLKHCVIVHGEHAVPETERDQNLMLVYMPLKGIHSGAIYQNNKDTMAL